MIKSWHFCHNYVVFTSRCRFGVIITLLLRHVPIGNVRISAKVCIKELAHHCLTRWRHQMETFSALLAICAGNSPPGEFPTQRPVTRSFDVYFDLSPNKRLSEQSWGWWFETPSRPLWRHRNESMDCCLFDREPLPEPKVTYRHLDITSSIRL